jgi:hypothetical protein
LLHGMRVRFGLSREVKMEEGVIKGGLLSTVTKRVCVLEELGEDLTLGEPFCQLVYRVPVFCSVF